MSYKKPIRRIAIVGAGVIGASWAAEYLARGFDVITTDPGPNAEANLRKYIDEAWKDLTNIGLSKGASRDRLTFTTDMKEALSKADFVQENGPERPDFKIKLFAQMDDAAPIDSIIASSSSGITPSVMQTNCKHPERVLVGHPFNPPHIVPLVEVVGGTKSSPEAIQQAIAFYASIGKKPIHLKKELPGHVGNRLQAALYKEIMYLIQHDVLSVEDADVAVNYGPGPRWGVMGPSLAPVTGRVHDRLSLSLSAAHHGAGVVHRLLEMARAANWGRKIQSGSPVLGEGLRTQFRGRRRHRHSDGIPIRNELGGFFQIRR